MKIYPTWLLILLAFAPDQVLFCQTQTLSSSDFSFTIQSSVLEEPRTFDVSLPSSYEGDSYYKDKHYPVVVLLDGPRLAPMFEQVLTNLSHPSVEKIPEMILVSVHNTNRTQDLLPFYDAWVEREGTLNFRTFLSEELLPEIDRRFRTLPSRLLVGHSHAGLFTLNAFLQEAPFQAFIAIDPNFLHQEKGLNKFLEHSLESSKALRGRVYIAKADNPFQPGFKETPIGLATQEFANLLARLPQQNVTSHLQWFEEEDHFSVPMIASYHGLRHVYRDYIYPLDKMVELKRATLKDYYAEISQGLGKGILPPAKVMHQIAEFLLHNQEREDLALLVLQFLHESYPTAHPVMIGLGEILSTQGKHKEAKQLFSKALELDPGNQYALTGLEMLPQE